MAASVQVGTSQRRLPRRRNRSGAARRRYDSEQAPGPRGIAARAARTAAALALRRRARMRGEHRKTALQRLTVARRTLRLSHHSAPALRTGARTPCTSIRITALRDFLSNSRRTRRPSAFGNFRIELRSAAALDFVNRQRRQHRRPLRVRMCHRVIGVGDRQNPRPDRNLTTPSSPRG